MTPDDVLSRSVARTALQSLQVQPARPVRPRSQGVVACLILLACCVYAFTWPYSRALGGIPLAGLAVASVAYAGHKAWTGRNFGFAPVCVIVCAYVLATILSIPSGSWTTVRDLSAIPQQVGSYILLPALVVCCRDALEYLHERRLLRKALLSIFLGSCLIAPWFTREFDVAKSVSDIFSVVSLANPDGIGLICITAYAYSSSRSRMLTILIGTLAILLGGNVSTSIVGLLLIIMILVPFPSIALFSYTAALTVFSIAAPYFALELFSVDPNTGVRALFWRDALSAVHDTSLLGVGYGTESVTNVYWELGGWQFNEEELNVLFIGVHNSFYQILFRCGIVGLLALAYLLWRLARLVMISTHDGRRHRMWLWMTLLTSMMINPAFDSINFLFANMFCIALIQAHIPIHPNAPRMGKVGTRWLSKSTTTKDY
jgi:hypothetical protein